VLSVDEALSIFDDFLRLGIIARSPDGLHRLALELACRYELPAAYDAHYVALAELLDCALWTDDRRLVTQIRPRPSYLRPISDYKQSTV
jgi:predicted nucleic acid-binding protein